MSGGTATATPGVAYLSSPTRLAAIFLTFPLITLPLVYLAVHPIESLSWVFDVYLWAFGITHFFVTLGLYLNSKTLDYFTSSTLNRAIYLAVPAVIFLYFGAASLIDPITQPGAAAVNQGVVSVVTAIAYFHRGRQAFGVLQMLKGQSRLPFSPIQRRLELTFFLVLPVLQVETSFLGGGHFWVSHPLGVASLVVVALLFAVVIALSVRAGRTAALGVPLGYFVLQTVIHVISSFDVRLYLACDATHYSEYHVLMYPRVVDAQLGARPVDRLMAWLRRPPLRFYLVVFVLAAMHTGLSGDQFGFGDFVNHGPRPITFAFNMMNGISLFHFFVDSFAWRFSNPFYRASLGPLYLKPAAA